MPKIVTSKKLELHERSTYVASLFGLSFPLLLEPRVYAFADLLADAYDGGYWEFYLLSNGGFCMTPNLPEPIVVNCPNHYEGHLSADALGIVVCLYTYSHVSFNKDEKLRELATEHYYLLRDYALQHAEAKAIFQAID